MSRGRIERATASAACVPDLRADRAPHAQDALLRRGVRVGRRRLRLVAARLLRRAQTAANMSKAPRQETERAARAGTNAEEA